MQLKKRLMYSGVVSAGALIASIIMPIIPCRSAPAVPNPVYKWGLCSLNPDSIRGIGYIREFFGYTSSLTDSYIITLLIAFTASMLFLHFAKKKKKK